MPYVDWVGDWSRLQPAVLTGARFYVFPLRVPLAPLQSICDQRIGAPSNQTVRATALPLPPLHPQDTLLLFAFADFPNITSQDPVERDKGFIRERDVAIFFPATVQVNGADKGIHLVNPFLWVDNPAGVINGRETFGFPKLMADIPWKASKLKFGVKTLVFPSHGPGTQATQKKVLATKRTGLLSCIPLLDMVEEAIQNLAPNSVVADVMKDAQQFVSDALEAGLSLSGFDTIKIPLLKQFRKIDDGVDTAFQKVVWAQFLIQQIHGMSFYPKLFGKQVLTLWDYDSAPIAKTLGLAPGDIDLGVGVRLDCDLVLSGGHFS